MLQAQAAALRRVGQGGLNEEAGEAGLELAGALGVQGDEARRRNDNVVSETEVLRQPSEAEQAIRLVVAQLRSLRGLAGPTGGPGPLLL